MNIMKGKKRKHRDSPRAQPYVVCALLSKLVQKVTFLAKALMPSYLKIKKKAWAWSRWLPVGNSCILSIFEKKESIQSITL